MWIYKHKTQSDHNCNAENKCIEIDIWFHWGNRCLTNSRHQQGCENSRLLSYPMMCQSLKFGKDAVQWIAGLIVWTAVVIKTWFLKLYFSIASLPTA